MASYLPVLLVSVSTNATPDDSALSTLPRGQVDYLSHDWQEEDVWKSWRNMTRQKNEIANGMRLENASWRTWWKQRNKLKTVSPETLNWLKDSDVTWLYGPLHTAVEWTPPPRKSTVTPNDHLDLSSPKHKPILKHRNLSEFLTSDLPHSPAFSPSESDSEQSADQQHRHSESQTDVSVGNQSRPPLGHTKSDTHITRWGPDRAFRKDSPPRVDPPAASAEDRTPGALRSSNHAYSGTDLNGYFQAHLRSSDNSPLSGSDANNSTNTNSSLQTQPKKKQKHITFNTFVEQCIAIDKPKSTRAEKVKKDSVSLPTGSRSGWDGRTGAKGVNWQMNYEDDDDEDVDEDGDEGGYDEDAEISSASPQTSSDEEGPPPHWEKQQSHSSSYRTARNDDDYADNECAICTDSESETEPSQPRTAYSCPLVNHVQDDSDDDDDGIIEMRPSRHTQVSTAPTPASQRSQSKASNASSSTSTSSTSTSSSINAESPNSTAPESGAEQRRRRGSKSGRNVKMASRRRHSSSASAATLRPQAPPSSSSSSSSSSLSSSSLVATNSLSPYTLASGPDHEQATQSHSAYNVSTIAPIAPTMLKTGGGGDDWSWDGFGVRHHFSGHHRTGHSQHNELWMEGFGDEGWSDEGYGNIYDGTKNNSTASGAPVELVYVPNPALGKGFGGSYRRDDTRDVDESEKEDDDAVPRARLAEDGGETTYHHKGSYFSVTDDPRQQLKAKKLERRAGGPPSPVRIVVRTPPQVQVDVEGSPYDYFGGMDMNPGEDYFGRPGGAGRRRVVRREDDGVEDERRENADPTASQSTTDPISTPKVSRPTSPPTTASLQPPPTRGRTSSPTGPSPATSPSSSPASAPPRGRSLTRSPSWSSGVSDRERSRSKSVSSTSPIGSLSPDGSHNSIGAVAGGLYAGDRSERERTGRRKEGRRLGSSSGSSVSPDAGSTMPDRDSLSSSITSSRTVRPSQGSVEDISESTPVASSQAEHDTMFAITEESRYPIEDADRLRSLQYTPTNSSSRSLRISHPSPNSTPTKSSAHDTESDSNCTTPTPSSPSQGHPFLSRQHARSTGHRTASDSSPTFQSNRAMDDKDDSLMGWMVNSAGSYLGFWH